MKVMKNRQLILLIGLEILIFLLLIAVFWMNEIVDLPHKLLGAPPTPFNWRENVIETALMLILGTGLIIATKLVYNKFRLLGKFIIICAACKRVKVGDKWIPVDVFINSQTDTDFSHGLCEECTKKLYGEILLNEL